MVTRSPKSTGSVGSTSSSSFCSSRAAPGVLLSTFRRSWSLPRRAAVIVERSRAKERMFSFWPCWVRSTVRPLRSSATVSSVCAEASRMNTEPLSSSACSSRPVSPKRMPSSSTITWRLLLVDRADEVVEVDQQVRLVDRERRLVAVEDGAVLGVGAVLVLRLEVEVLLADRRQVVDVDRRVGRQLDLLLDRHLDLDALARRGHLGDLADLDAAVGHLAALEQSAGARQGRGHRVPAPGDPLDQAEVAGGDVGDADRAQDDERAQPDPDSAAHHVVTPSRPDGSSDESGSTPRTSSSRQAGDAVGQAVERVVETGRG